MAYLEIKGINKSFSGRQVLSNINLAVNKGSFISLLGQSGCGKTTLLRIIAGLEQADSGSIFLDGKDIVNLPIQQRNIGIVFQNYALFPHMNVFDNIAYGLKIKKDDPALIQQKVNDVLEKVGLSQKAKQNVSLLSGGEQQRVALARAVVTEPQIILLDEPISNLDFALRLQARNELKRLQNEIGITSIYVTHDQSEALALSDQVSVMDNGNIVQTGTPLEIYDQPTGIFTAGFVGRYNLFETQQAAELFNRSLKANERLAVLPEKLGLLNSDIKTSIIIKEVLFTGALTEYILAAGDHLFKSVMLTNTAAGFRKGSYVMLDVSEKDIKIIGQNNDQ